MAGEVPEVTITCSGETFHPVALMVMGADGLPQFQQPQAVGVMGLAFPDRPDTGFLDTFRGIKIRFPHFQVDDLFARPFQGLGGFQDIHDDKGRDFPGPQ